MNEGSGGGNPTPIMLQEVNATTGVSQIGKATQILERGDSDGPLVEAPSLMRSSEGIYVLFFSSQCYSGLSYDTSYAASTTLTVKYKKIANP